MRDLRWWLRDRAAISTIAAAMFVVGVCTLIFAAGAVDDTAGDSAETPASGNASPLAIPVVPELPVLQANSLLPPANSNSPATEGLRIMKRLRRESATPEFEQFQIDSRDGIDPPGVEQAGVERTGEPTSRRIVILRDTARQLEAQAARLEQESLYDQADRLRQAAVQMWRQARKMPEAGSEPKRSDQRKNEVAEESTSPVRPSRAARRIGRLLRRAR